MQKNLHAFFSVSTMLQSEVSNFKETLKTNVFIEWRENNLPKLLKSIETASKEHIAQTNQLKGISNKQKKEDTSVT